MHGQAINMALFVLFLEEDAREEVVPPAPAELDDDGLL